MRQPLFALLLGALLLAACDEDVQPAAPAASAPAASAPAASAPAAERFAAIDEDLRAGRLDQAKSALEALYEQGDRSPQLIARLAGIATRQEEPARAVVLYKKGLEANPDSGGLWSSLGDVYWQLRQFDKAVDSFEQARAHGQDDAFVALSLGISYGQLGALERSEKELERARELGAKPETVDYNLALLRVAQKRYRDAVELLRGVVESAPEDANARRELGAALMLADPGTPATLEEVQKIAWQVVDSQPTDWRAQMLLGDVFSAQQDWVAAVEAYTEALRQGHNPPEVEERYVSAMTALKAAEKAGGEAH